MIPFAGVMDACCIGTSCSQTTNAYCTGIFTPYLPGATLSMRGNVAANARGQLNPAVEVVGNERQSPGFSNLGAMNQDGVNDGRDIALFMNTLSNPSPK